ncbi:hypothetical protein, partial [Lentilactobacillus farraginis]|uniref:hypothetical protein n=1 Tax=Lentilactobacillus farraginis TaxID=390841 RepID=UPI001F32CCC0
PKGDAHKSPSIRFDFDPFFGCSLTVVGESKFESSNQFVIRACVDVWASLMSTSNFQLTQEVLKILPKTDII